MNPDQMTERLSDSDRRHLLQRSRATAAVVLVELDLLIRTLRDMQAGFPSGHEGGSGGWDDRTQAAAMQYDRARHDLRQVDKLIRDIDAKLGELDSIREHWTTTTTDQPTGEQTDPGCRSCGRLNATIRGQQVPVWVPRRELSTKTVQRGVDGDVIQETIISYSAYCEWCDDWFNAEGEPPPLRVVQAHHDGKRITNSLLDKLGVKTKSASARDRRKAS